MLTRLTDFFFKTLRDDPNDAEVASHKLLVRAGYIRRQGPGIFAWLPLGLRVKNKIEAIIREEMKAAGAHEVHFPALLPKSPYERTGRWEEYGDNLFRLSDRKEADYLLAPTHEEVFTLLVKDLYSSYKELPITLYQIQDKYRDEARPRAGLLRGREFTMKDAYSFDVTDEGLCQSYQKQRDAYERIFTRLGLEYVIVQADAGAMGGSRSEEFLCPTAVGEDTFVRSPGGYAANIEAFRTLPALAQPTEGLPLPHVEITTQAHAIEQVVAYAKEHGIFGVHGVLEACDFLKNIVLKLTFPDGKKEHVIVGIPADREVDLKRAEIVFAPAAVELADVVNDSDVEPKVVVGYIGPWKEGIGQYFGHVSSFGERALKYFVDPRVVEGTVWATGANIYEKHVFGLVAGRDFAWDGVVDIAEVCDGDPAPDGSGPVEKMRGMEIGHVFQLGRKYAQALGLKVLDENGSQQTVAMGSYGIGVTRLVALLAEQYHDEKGLLWADAVTPFDVLVVAVGKESVAFDLAEDISNRLETLGKDVLFDDRPKLSPGVKFSDAELIGIAHILVVGKGASDGQVEVWNRFENTKTTVSVEEAIAMLDKKR